MNKKLILLLFLTLSVAVMAVGDVSAANVNSTNHTDKIADDHNISINSSSPDPRVMRGGIEIYTTTSIQDAVDHAIDGDTIEVDEGIYTENVVVNHRLAIIATGLTANTIVQAPTDHTYQPVFTINSGGSGSSIYGLTITGATDTGGIILNSSGNTISGNTIINNNFGICLTSDNNTISGNKITNNGGIYFYGSSGNHIINNQITDNNDLGIDLENSSDNNIISGNQITNNSQGIYLSVSSGNQITDNQITDNETGIHLYNASDNYIISGNNIANNIYYGILLQDSSGNQITDNQITDNNDTGIGLYSSSDNHITGNQISDCNIGILLQDSGIDLPNEVSGNIITACLSMEDELGDIWSGYGIRSESSYSTISGNQIHDNEYGIDLLPEYSNNTLIGNILGDNTYNLSIHFFYDVDPMDFSLTIDTTNTINGKPVYFIVGDTSGSLVIDGTQSPYSSGIGYLGLISCSGVQVRNISIDHNGQGILFVDTTISSIQNSTFNNNYDGIYLYKSSDNHIMDNIQITDNDTGIYLEYSSGNIMSRNNITNNQFGIDLSYNSSNNQITDNKQITNNSESGILLEYSDNILVSGNNITNNDYWGIYLYRSSGNTISGNDISNNNDYGIYIEYNDSDEGDAIIQFNRIVGNNCGIRLCVDKIIDATLNWWGPDDPSSMISISDSVVSGSVNIDPWLILTIKADPTSIPPNTGESELTVDLTHDSNPSNPAHEPIPEDPASHVPDGIPVDFDPGSMGILNFNNRLLSGGRASVIFTGDSSTSPPPATITATVDGVTVPVDVNIQADTAPPTAVYDTVTGNEDTNITTNVTANDNDPEGDTIIITNVTNGAHGTTHKNGDGTVTYTPQPNWNGVDTYTYTINGGSNATVTIIVLPVNDPPILNPIGNKNIDENDTLIIIPTGSDPDGNPLTFNAENLPTGATFIGGTFTWTSTYSQSGNYQVTFTVTDGTVTTSGTITIHVENTNRPPVLNTIGNKNINENNTLQIKPAGTDPDGDTLSYTATGLPIGATYTNGVFNWKPTNSQSGKYGITFIVSDGGLTDSETITITVNNVNRSPVLGKIGDQTVEEGYILSFTVKATDPDNDKLTYSASGLPTGASINSKTGVFTWRPSYSQAGNYIVTFKVSDGKITTSKTIKITVNDVKLHKNEIKIVNIGSGRIYVKYTIKITDNNGRITNKTITGFINSGKALNYTIGNYPSKTKIHITQYIYNKASIPENINVDNYIFIGGKQYFYQKVSKENINAGSYVKI